MATLDRPVTKTLSGNLPLKLSVQPPDQTGVGVLQSGKASMQKA